MTDKRRLIPEDLYKLAFIADPQISPDGTRIAYTRTVIDEKTKEYRSHIWVVNADGTCNRQFTAGPKSDTTPRWSPDGTNLAFVSDRNGEKQIFVIPAGGGEAHQVTKMRYGASSPVWSPDGKSIAFVAPVDPSDRPEDYEKPLDSKEKEELEKKKRDEPTVVTRLKAKADSAMGLLSPRRNHVFVIDAEGTGPARQLTTGEYDYDSPSWSPDEKYIAVSSNRSPDADWETWISDIFVVPAGGGELRQLTRREGPAYLPVWTPDGKFIVYVGNKQEHGTATLDRLWKVPVEGGDPVPLTESFDRSVGNSCLTDSRYGASEGGVRVVPDGKTIYFLASDSGRTSVFSVPIDGGAVSLVLGGDREIYGFSLDSSASKLAIAYSTPTLPGDVALYDLASCSEKTLTFSNKNLLDQVYLIEPELVPFSAADGLEEYGWIMKPVGYQPGKKYPAILEIHGGPHSTYGYAFFLEFQLLASAGYGVIYTNPRGSEGFGQHFVKAVIGDYGGMDYKDLMTWVDKAISLGFIDESRLGVTGGSYGGFMTNWIVGHTDRFSAAVTQRSISNWLSFFGVSDIGYTFAVRELGGDPVHDTEKLWRFSPLAYVDNVKTPLLILHSEQDMRCPIEQGEQLYVALKKAKREVEMLRFPGSNHELSRSGRPALRVARLKHILRWFDAHIEKIPGDYSPELARPAG